MGSAHVALRVSDLVGRDAELRLLGKRISEAADGRGCSVLLAGEPGIGKTRLADAAAGRARRCGFRVVWGRCRETEGAPPFWPWVQILRGLVTGSGAAEPTDLRTLLDSSPKTARSADRFQLFDATVTYLLGEAHRQPMLLVFDDLHRADHSSLQLLRFLIPGVRDGRVFVIGTYRNTEVPPSHPLFTLIGETCGGVGVDVIELEGLTLQETTHLVASHMPAAAQLRAKEFHERSGGNPFFLTEILRLRPEVGETVPNTVRAAISARIARLPPATHRVLSLAAVLGREFRPELLASFDGAGIAETHRHLASAVSAGFVLANAEAEGGYRFTHVLIREALYEAIPLARRIQLHDRVVRILESSAGTGLAGPSDVATHAARALRTSEERQRAVRLAVRAAVLARDRLAHEEAADWFSRALDLGVDSDDERFELLLELGQAAGRAFRVAPARSAYERAWALADRQGSNHRLTQAALGLGDVIVSAGTVDTGLVWMLEQSLDRAEPADRQGRIRLTARLSVEIYWSAQLPKARQLAAEAVAAARRLGDTRTLAVSLAAQQFVLRGPDHLSERIRLGTELVGHACVLGDEQLELNARRLLLADRLQVGPETAATDFEELAALAERTRRPLAQWYLRTNRVIWATMAGRCEEALGIVAEAEAFGRRIGARPTAVYAAFQHFAVLHELGRSGESVDELRAAIREFPVVIALRCTLALSLAEAGRQLEAEAMFTDLVAGDCRAVPPDALWMSGLAMLAMAAAKLDRPAEAATLHRLLLPHVGKVVQQGVVMWWGAVDHYLGLTAMVTGRWDEAEVRFQAGLQLHEAWAAVPFIRASVDGLAELLRRRAGPGDRLRASNLTDRWVAKLTGREREILQLLAVGAANKQIARQLDISIHTVERHIANVYNKIGVRNRAEATAFALRNAD
jgi:DNA-binding CsgD family transcriptional regulator